MAQFIEFMGNHPIEFMVLGVIIGLLAWNILGEQLTGIQPLLPQEATLLINHDDAVVIDVREETEYTQGHILNAINIPSSALSSKINRLEKYRSHPIIISCMSGSRSAVACKRLKKEGFMQVHNLKGGIIAWQNANLPLVKGK
jgi:rhodanese-related sulfurtransferase